MSKAKNVNASILDPAADFCTQVCMTFASPVSQQPLPTDAAHFQGYLGTQDSHGNHSFGLKLSNPPQVSIRKEGNKLSKIK